MEVNEEDLPEFFEFMFDHLDEKQRRLLAGGVARLVGRGGPTTVAEASGMSRNTVIAGAKAYDAKQAPTGRVRAEGGGRPRLEDLDPTLLEDLDDLVEPDSRGDPMSPLRWTLKSTRQRSSWNRISGDDPFTARFEVTLIFTPSRIPSTAYRTGSPALVNSAPARPVSCCHSRARVGRDIGGGVHDLPG